MPVRDSEFAEIMACLGQLIYDELSGQQIKHELENQTGKSILASGNKGDCNV